MAYGGLNKWMDAAAEIGRNPASKTPDSARRGTGPPNPSRETKFSGANAHREIILIFPVQLTTSRIGNLIWLILTLVICGGVHTYMDAAAELGRNPVSKHQMIQPEYGDEQADAGRDG